MITSDPFPPPTLDYKKLKIYIGKQNVSQIMQERAACLKSPKKMMLYNIFARPALCFIVYRSMIVAARATAAPTRLIPRVPAPFAWRGLYVAVAAPVPVAQYALVAVPLVGTHGPDP